MGILDVRSARKVQPVVEAQAKVKPKARVKKQQEQQPKSNELLGNIGSFKKSDNVVMVASISEFQDDLKFDLREHQISERYTGPTKKGINISTESFMDLYNLMTKVKEHLEAHGMLQE